MSKSEAELVKLILNMDDETFEAIHEAFQIYGTNYVAGAIAMIATVRTLRKEGQLG